MPPWPNPYMPPLKRLPQDRCLPPPKWLGPSTLYAQLYWLHPPLFLPNPNYPHHLYTDEKGGIAFGALLQPIGPKLLPIAYISKQPDTTARGWFPCLRALAAATTLYADAKKLIHGQPLTIFSPHCLGNLLASRLLSDLSESRLQQFHLVFLDNPQVSVGRFSIASPSHQEASTSLLS